MSHLTPEEHNELDAIANELITCMSKDAASTVKGAAGIVDFVIAGDVYELYSSRGYPFRTFKDDQLENLIENNVYLHKAIKRAFLERSYASIRDMGEWLE